MNSNTLERVYEARVHIKTAAGELELAGERSFVESYQNEIQKALATFFAESVAEPVSSGYREEITTSQSSPQAFGEYFSGFPKKITDVDRVLVAGLYLQDRDSSRVFKTGAVNELLQHQGIRVANPSMCVRRSVENRRAFGVGKGSYRVSQAGVDYVRALLGGGVE